MAGSFWRELSSPRHIAAPMVHQSERAFRQLVRLHGCHLAFTQMLPAHKFASSRKFRERAADWEPPGDRPLIVQFNGHDADSLVEAGRLLEDTVDGIDLNLGCPQNIAKRGNYGAYLLQNQDLSLHILSRMAKEIKIPVSAKIRIFEDPESTIKFAKSVEECGVQMITVHGRTIHEKKQFVKAANWAIIRDIKSQLKIPVVANGGIGCYADIARCLQVTGADAVMSSEALLENPKLFCPVGDKEFRENYVVSQLKTVDEYLDLLQQYPHLYPFVPVVKGHLFKMLHRFICASRNHDLRNTLGNCHDINGLISVVKEVAKRTDAFQGRDLIAVRDGYLTERTWYERHHEGMS